MKRTAHFLLGLATIFKATRATLYTAGITMMLSEVPYFVAPESVGSVSIQTFNFSGSGAAGLVPVTVITTLQSFSTEDLSSVALDFGNRDDVFQQAFLEYAIVQYNGSSQPQLGNTTLSSGAVPYDISRTNYRQIPNGPYFASASGLLYKAYRLYSDFEGAFTETAIEKSNGTFAVLPAGVPGQSLSIAVPSRLYYTRTEEQPLAGIRLGVKDIFDIAGLKTGNGNRAWYHLYPAATRTSAVVQNLLNAGAVVVGKMKTSQFANGEHGGDWVDYHQPFNPRGDGYQDSSESSSGPGVGAGAYPWLDLALGSDTGGSVRWPAAVQGVYGNRPSHGLAPMADAMSLAPQLDTAGLLARDPAIWTAAAKAMYGSNITISSAYPVNIKTVGFPTEAREPGDQLLMSWLSNATDFINATALPFDIRARWNSTRPAGTPPLDDMFNETYAIFVSQEQTRRLRDPFYADYAMAHDGRLPFVDPVPLARWRYGDSQPPRLEEAEANKTAFMEFFSSEVLRPSPDTCSDSLVFYVNSRVPTYRYEHRDPPRPPFGFSETMLSVFSEAPDVVVPIGEAEYYSSVTNHTEKLPVTVSIMAANGCDGMIFSLIEDLCRAGILQGSQTGMSQVDSGEVLFKRNNF
ncbi:amidase signature domain-containing protein [Lineolata rhizophorae]|uniref:Amidase signature domain-containing protein n=1 Tax=Lineolata rhizophorae TaxID=578093 RepID=A0A6A6P3A3_9PEZI|nr:amidase signature domain-containing protein [Lineolata rhizophorae]